MALLQLPAELRLQIYDFLPDLSPGRLETVARNVRLTPSISRVSRQLREETVPIYAHSGHFLIQLDGLAPTIEAGFTLWMQALGQRGLRHIRNLQLAHHWKAHQPTRWQGHVGFYVRLVRLDDGWQCTTGTYPIARDARGMRLESVELLQRKIELEVFPPALSVKKERDLRCADVEFIVKAMDVVASHPVSPHDMEQSEGGRKHRMVMWTEMEHRLFALSAAPHEVNDQPRQSFTRY